MTAASMDKWVGGPLNWWAYGSVVGGWSVGDWQVSRFDKTSLKIWLGLLAFDMRDMEINRNKQVLLPSQMNDFVNYQKQHIWLTFQIYEMR